MLKSRLQCHGLTLPTFSCPDGSVAAQRASKPRCPAGSTKLVVQAVEIRDVLGRFGKASGLDAGVILSTWNPDAGWEKDALVSHLRSLRVFLSRVGDLASPYCPRGSMRNEAVRPWGVLCSLEAQQPV